MCFLGCNRLALDLFILILSAILKSSRGTMTNGDVKGNRFSLLYLERGTPVRDSKRFRIRLYAMMRDLCTQDDLWPFSKMIRSRLGVIVPSGYHGSHWNEFFESAEIRDILDCITIFRDCLIENNPYNVKKLQPGVENIFREENMGYTVDGNCVVHYFVDEEFERNRFSTLTCLTPKKYAAVRNAFEDCYRHLDSRPVDTKAAVRANFEALEILFKQMVQANGPKDRLNSHGVISKLKPMVEIFYQENDPAQRSAGHILPGFLDWIDAAHIYRHGQATEEPAPPPIDLAVHLISMGTSFLRWLVGMDQGE